MVEYKDGTYRRRSDGQGEAFRPGANRSREARRRAHADVAHTCERVSVDPRFVKLRRRFAFQFGGLVSVFLVSYLGYLALSAYARDFMSVQIVDSINVALVMGIGQFLVTFVLAWAFGRFSARAIDPLAEQIRVQAGNAEAINGRVVR